jgi:hypothetical protein
MPITARKLPEYPLIVVHTEGHLSVAEIIAHFKEMDTILTRHEPATLFMIADMYDTNVSYHTLFQALDESKNVPGGMYDTRMTPIIVADMDFGEMLEEQIQNRFPDINIPFFSSRARAFSFVAFLMAT